jgi:plastocyanin
MTAMPRQFMARVIVLASAFLAAAVYQTAAAPAVHRITISKMAFGTAPPGIHQGDTVEWVNEDIFLHSVTADDKSFDVDVAPKARVSIVMKHPGVIHYICKYHPTMKGELVVAN